MSKRIIARGLGIALCIAGGTVSAADSATQPVVVMKEFHAKWASDPAYIDKLARDANPRYAANKRLVLEFEAALERYASIGDRA